MAEKIGRSTAEAYSGLAIAIIAVVFPVTWWLKIVLMMVVGGLAIDIAFRHPKTIEFHWLKKLGISVLGIGILSAISYLPIHKQYVEDSAAALSGELEAPPSDVNFNDSDVKFLIGAGLDGTKISWTGGKGPIFTIAGSKLLIRRENGKLLLSVDVRERGSGAVVVNITDNRWTISSAQNVSWDHNYTRNALEVKDGRGRVVLQVVLMPESVRFQGEWWHEDGNGGRVVRPYPYDPVKTGPVFVIMTPVYHPDVPTIEPIFKYPSK